MVAASEVTGNSSVRFECQPSKNLLRQLRYDEGETRLTGGDKKLYQTPKNNESLKAAAGCSPGSITKPTNALGPRSGPESITGSTTPSVALSAAQNSLSHLSAGSSLSNSVYGDGSSYDSTVSNTKCPSSPSLTSQPVSSLLNLSMECLNSEDGICADLSTSSGRLPPGRANMSYGVQLPFQSQNIPIPPKFNDTSHVASSAAYNSNGYYLGAQHQIQEGLYQRYQQQQQQQQHYQYPNAFEQYQIQSNSHSQMPDGSIYYGPVQTQFQPHQVPIRPQLQTEEFVYASQGASVSVPLAGVPIPMTYTVRNPGYNDASANQRILYPSVPVYTSSPVGVHYGYYPYTQQLGQNNDGNLAVSPIAYSYSPPTSGSQTPATGTYTPVSLAYTTHSRSPVDYSSSVSVVEDGSSQQYSNLNNDFTTVSNETHSQYQPKHNKSKKKNTSNDVVKRRFYRGP